MTNSRPLGHGPMKYMSNFKAFAIDYEYYLTLSDVPQSVCLTERQMYVLSVQNSYTPWLTRWYNTDDITEKTVQFIASEIESLLVMCNCGVPALTPTDIFNTTNYVTTTTTIYNETQNTWNEGGQTVVSIAPDLDFDTGSPADISKLICLAIDLLIHSIIAQGKTMNTQTAAQNTNLLNVISSALGGLATAGGIAALIEGVGAAAVGLLGGPWMLLGLALGAVGLKVATLFMGADNALFDNTEAIANVICAAQTNLEGLQVTRSVFMSALTPLGYASDSPEGQLAAMIQPFLDDLDTYLQFMTIGNQLYSAVTLVALPECGCNNRDTPLFTLRNGVLGGVPPDIYEPSWIGPDGSDRDIWEITAPLNQDGNYQFYVYRPDSSSFLAFHVYAWEWIEGELETGWFNNYISSGPYITVNPTGEDVNSINQVGYTEVRRARITVGEPLE